MTEKIIFIPARLKSSVVGGHVTGASDIIDDARNKPQDVINSEVSEDSADIHEHINIIEGKIPSAASSSNKLVDKASLTAETQRATAAENANADAISAEEVRAKGVEQTNATTISNEITRATEAENTLQENIEAENQRAVAAETIHTEGIAAINAKIPSAASSENQLADKAFVNSSISTSTAEFRGTSEPGLTEEQFLAWANSLTKDVNDYVYWNTEDNTGNTQYKKYKYNGSTWLYEYTLNNSSFTSDQWATINSGLTDNHKIKLDALPTNAELTTAFNNKQDVISDLEAIRSGAALGATAYQKPSSGVPSSDMTSEVQESLGKADTAYQKPFNGIPESDLDNATQSKIDAGETAYQKPNTGIPKEDLTSAVQESLAKADTALQEHQSLDNYYVKSEVDTLLDDKAATDNVYTKGEINSLLFDKQNTLVSGTNIKTVNGYTLLGSGDLTISTTGVASDADPLMDGIASAGTSTEYSRGDHRHPSDDSKQDVLIFATTEESIEAAEELT